MKTIAIINPTSGDGDENFHTMVDKALQANSLNAEIWETTPDTNGEVLARQAKQQGAGHIIACGGDGTIMAVVNGLGEKHDDVVLSIIPGGTANLLAGALEIPHDLQEAAEVAASDHTKTIDLGRCGDKLFALGVGLGLTERVVSGTTTREKGQIGKLAYAHAMLREMGKAPVQFSFRLDDGTAQTEHGVAVVIANAGQIDDKLQFAPGAKMDDGKLDLCVLRRFYFRDFLRMLWHSLQGKLPSDRAVSFYQAAKIEVRSEPPLDLQIDGEVVNMHTPLVAQVLPGALKVTVPKSRN